MSLAKRIIPTILNKRGQLVKGVGFAADRVVGNTLQAARIHAMRAVDEIMILDVTATQDGREPDYAMIRKLSDKCFSPLAVGGGVSHADHVRGLLCAGADKVCIGARSVDQGFIKDLSDRFGRQCITVSIDDNGSRSDSSKPPVWRAAGLQAAGAGEILLQSVSSDGRMTGYDLELIEDVAKATSIPVIASGGCSGYEDMYNAIKAGADAVAAGALFQFTECTPKGAAEYLNSRGVEVRL